MVVTRQPTKSDIEVFIVANEAGYATHISPNIFFSPNTLSDYYQANLQLWRSDYYSTQAAPLAK
jgi:hypothetical protein